MVIQFPKLGELHLKDDPMSRMRTALQLFGFVGGVRKYFSVVVLGYEMLFLIVRAYYVILGIKDPAKLIDLAKYIPLSIMAPLKMLHLYLDKKRVEYFYSTVNNEFWDYRVCGQKAEKKARGSFKFTNRCVTAHFTTAFTFVLLFQVFSVTNKSDSTDTFFRLIFAVDGVLSYLGNMVYDFLFIYCVQHLSVQFELLKALVSNITDGVMEDSSDVERFNSAYFQRTIMDRFKICVEHHSRLLKYGKNIESYCTKILVLQLVMTYAGLVMHVYRMNAHSNELFKAVLLSGACLCSTNELLLFLLPSGSLYEQSISLLDAMYDSKWYLFNADMKRAYIIMMMNGEEGIVIKAGGVTQVDHPLLVELMQKVFSAVTILQALIGDEAE